MNIIKFKNIICALTIIVILISSSGCKAPEEDASNDFEISVSLLSAELNTSEDEAKEILFSLSELGFDDRIERIDSAEDDNGLEFYKIWFGLKLAKVYFNADGVDKVYRNGILIYSSTPISSELESTEDGEQLLSIEIISLTSPVQSGQNASIEVLGNPNTEYTISVKYSSSISSASGLEPKISDYNGYVSWTWRVGNSVKPGEYSITISSNGMSYTTTFEVE